MPRKGILLTLAYLIASIFPLVPLFPNPPGIKIPDIFFNLVFISKALSFSESIRTNLTLILFAMPPWVSASSKDLYASFNSMYLPITAIFTSFFVLRIILLIFLHGVKLHDFFDLILK